MPSIMTIISIGIIEERISVIPPLLLPETIRTFSCSALAKGPGKAQGSAVEFGPQPDHQAVSSVLDASQRTGHQDHIHRSRLFYGSELGSSNISVCPTQALTRCFPRYWYSKEPPEGSDWYHSYPVLEGDRDPHRISSRETLVKAKGARFISNTVSSPRLSRNR